MTANGEKKCKVDRDESSKSINGCTVLKESVLEKVKEKNAKLDNKANACIDVGDNSVEVFAKSLPSGSNGNSKTPGASYAQQAAFKGRMLDDGKDGKQEVLTSFTRLHVAHPVEDDEDECNGYNRFYFESDHLALKDNKHYHLLLQTLLVLEAQRSQAVKDLDVLCKQQANALKDPVGFVEKLQDNEPLGLPSRQRVVKLPSIPWEEYSVSIGPLDQQKFSNPHHTRAAVHTLGKAVPPGQQTSDGAAATSFSSENNVYSVFGGEFVASKPGKPLDRESLTTVLGLRGELGDGKLAKGRLSDENKPVTFNQPWTADEQAKLEKLLQIYPQEEVESKRWEKIAAALGNRTLKQVASRVQKYFIKLARAGLPVPGRMPNVPRPSARSKRSYQHYQTIGFRNSTFFPSYRPRVLMDDEDDVSSVATDDTAGYLSDEESVPADLRDTDEYKELMELKRIKRQKIMECQQRSEYPVHHNGFICDGCGVTPIRGTRWHCRDCTQDNSTDFCSECFERGNVNIGHHTAEHSLEPVTRNASFFIDGDYIGLSGGATSAGYNYLDPNFLPAAS